MNKLTLNEVESEVSKLERITSASISHGSAIGDVLDVIATTLKTKNLKVKDDNINYLTAGALGPGGTYSQIYLKTDGDIQTRGLRITKENEQPLILTYELLQKLINL
tara:strand:+ start:1564 stop:1884 length:321 start_codon:yes stop_codon:yes gene_type:complete